MTWREVTDQDGTSVVLDDTFGEGERISIQGRNVHPTNVDKVFVKMGVLSKDGNSKGDDERDDDYIFLIFDRTEFVEAIKQEFNLFSFQDVFNAMLP